MRNAFALTLLAIAGILLLVVWSGCGYTVAKKSTIDNLDTEIATLRSQLAVCKDANEAARIEALISNLLQQREETTSGTENKPDT